MKKCPQCGAAYTAEILYCLTDGALLVEDPGSRSSAVDPEEPDTIVRYSPIVIDVPPSNEPFEPRDEKPFPITAPSNQASDASANRHYALFLLLGLVLGGGLVLATLLISRSLFRDETISSGAAPKANYEQAVQPKSSPEIRNDADDVSRPVVSDKHSMPVETVNAENFNGRVIAINARVRSAPGKDAAVVDTVPMNDRLNIVGRENPNSPWFEVECEHETSGWMHGDTIEFTPPQM